MKINTFFKNAKHLILVLMILSFSTTIFAGGIHFDDHYSDVTLKMHPENGAGDVYIHFTSFNEEDAKTNDNITNHIKYSCKDKYGWGAFDSGDTHIHYMLAISDDDENDYLWDAWYKKKAGDATDEYSELHSESPYITSPEINADPENDNDKTQTVYFTYLAKWLLPKITDVTTNKEEIIQNKDNKSCEVTFMLSEAKSADNFTYHLEGENFNLISNSATPENYPSEFKMQLQYIPKGIHTASSPTIQRAEYAVSLCSLTTTSKYHGAEQGNPSSKTFTWTVKEDYTPNFEMAFSECVFAKVTPEEYGTTIAEGAISPNTTLWNYAAKQAYPTTDDGEDLISPEDDFLRDGCIWKIKITDNYNEYFSINKTNLDEENGYYEVTSEELTNINQNIIRFSPPTDAEDTDVYSATLHVKCAYYDAVGNIIESPEEKTITLKGQALLEEVVLINNSEEAYITFDDVLCGVPLKYNNGSEVTSKTATYITNISNISTEITGIGKDYFEIDADKENKLITVTLKNDVIPGIHEAKLTITGTYEDDDTHEIKTKTATLDIIANVVLANPILTGYAENNKDKENGEAVLSWTPIAGATSYTLYYTNNDNIVAGEGTEKDCGSSTEIRIPGLPYNSTYSFVVVAKYGALEAVSNRIVLYPTDFPSTIIWANRVTSLYTGTEKEGNSHPYMTKRKVDVTAAFDATSQNALFDYVVIFGKTEGDNSNNVTYSNANTPCYVYEKSDDKTYTILKMGQDDYVNMNRTTKHPGFTIDATADSDKQMSIYITGYCPYASTGTTWQENAVMHITGNGGTSVDVYLDNTQIYARAKSTTKADMNDVFDSFSDVTGGYMQGSGAIFAFTSTSGTFRPKIHLLGDNVIQSHDGLTLEGERVIKETITTGFLQSITINNTFYGKYAQHSSPIQILPLGLGQATELTIDNLWCDGVRTNGALNLKTNENSTAPLIDQGNENSKIILGGGKITFSNTANRNIISYRRCIRTDEKVEAYDGDNKVTIRQTRTIYGASSAVGNKTTGTQSSHDIEDKPIALTTDNGITFNDGTFNATHPITVPKTTEVNGGSYNCTFAHSPTKNRYGKDVQRIELSTSTITPEMATIEDGLIIFKDGIVGFKKWMDKIHPEANWQDSENPVHYASVSSYYDGANKTYGYSSFMPNADGKVYLMLPKDETPTIKPWVVSGPAFEGKTAGIANQEEIAMIYNTHQQEVNTFGKTYNMLYLEADKYMQEAVPAGNDYNCNGALVSPTYNNPPVVGNIEAYTISNKAYIMKPIVATDWMLFCPPFDVANIYIIESYPETQLVKDYADGAWKIPSENITAARHAQAKRTMDFYLLWWYFTQQGGSTEDFFVGESDYASYVHFWMNYEAGRDKDGKAPESGTDYTPVIDKLCHFMGEEATYPGGQPWYNAAHYYLYESNGSWANEGETYKTAWNIVKTYPNGNNAIMKAGKVYALNFPYNTMGGHNPETTWDYWTGKYILIESTTKTNGHTIQGSGVDMLGIKTVAEGEKAWLCGNPSFAVTDPLDGDTPSEQVWVVQNNRGGTNAETGTVKINTHEMVPLGDGLSSALKPTQAFLLAEPTLPMSNMRARTINYQTGEVTYETIEGEDDNNDPGIGTGIPTIMGDVSLLVVPTEEGLTIIPRTAQRVMLFAADGKMLFNEHLSAEEHINVPTGVYIVRGEYEQVKAIKK